MWKDPIVEEVRTLRDEHARAFQYDADAIFSDLLKKQAAHAEAGVQFVSFPPRRPAGWIMSNRSSQESKTKTH